MLPLHSWLGNDSIQFRLFRLVLLVSVVAMLLSTISGVLLAWNNHQREVSHSLATSARAAGLAASAAVVFRDAKAAEEALRVLVSRRDIEAATLYMVDGRRLAGHGETAGLPENVVQAAERLPDFGLFSATTILCQPIVLDGAAIGTICLRANLRDSRRLYLLQAVLTMGANFAALALAVWLGLRAMGRIVRPIRALADTSRQLRESRDFSLRAPSPEAGTAGGGEVAELIGSFNAMVAEIEQRERVLNHYHAGLEEMVMERTRALHAANREMELARDAAEAASLAKSRFLAAASHDLRQPIQAINLFGTALQRTDLSDEQSRIARYIAQSATSLGELLDALLDISRFDSGAVTPAAGAVEVHDLFSLMAGKFSPLAEAKGLRFKLHFPMGDAAVLTDGELLQSLLGNLVANAIKYTGRGGVLVALRRRGGEALVQVWDTGIGIEPEHMGRIFDEYFQVGNPERNKAKGLGLGLAIVKRLANLLGTEVTCRSRPGAGTVFQFRLPFATGPRPGNGDGRQAGVVPVPADCGGDRHVVVIDDDASVAHAVRMSLESAGIRVTTHGSAEEALADERIASADFYISDLRLPGASGLELLAAIERRAGGPIRAVLLTGDTSPALGEGAAPARWPRLRKPVGLAELLAAIEAGDGD